ncbi:MAG: ABC transporter permease, partial [Flavobacteriaceae bacterium]|nr:ABC transporter permease [Flavobacteriaceae bacterium]
MIQIWFKIFFRNSKKNWLNMLVNILGLTLGFTGLLIVLLYLNDEQSYNANNLNKEELFRVLHKTPNRGVAFHSIPVEGPTYKEDIPEITEYYVSNVWYSATLVKANGKEQFSEGILQGEPNFFEFFPFKIIEGSEKTFQEARNHIAISQGQATAFFGNESAIGKMLEFSNRTFVVTTVYEIVGKHYFMPNIIIQYKKQPEGQDWATDFSVHLFVKTTKGAAIKSVEKKALAVWYQNYELPASRKEGISPKEFIKEHEITPVLESINDIRLKSITGAGPEGKGNYQLILIMLFLSILLIIISCVNFINLSIASATQRGKEVGVKKTLGLSKMTLTRQYALEIVLQGAI